MGPHAVHLPTALDLPTLVAVATAISALLGLFLLAIWRQERVRALAWWGAAYLLGGFSVSFWNADASGAGLPGFSNALLLLACGIAWTGARLFHGRPILWGAMTAGSFGWLLACSFPSFAAASADRFVLSALIVAAYAFLTAQELWRERRKALIWRGPAVLAPLLHAVVFLAPATLAAMIPHEAEQAAWWTGWFAVFAVQAILYLIGVALIVVVLSKERALRVEKTAAHTDPLTGLFNRRGFFESAQKMRAAQIRKREPLAALIFDLDNFKAVNDAYGHFVGDEVLLTFAATVSATLRAGDLIARLGGEEFVALLPADADAAAAAAERVRRTFEEAGRVVGPHMVGATVSVGVAAAAATSEVPALLFEADIALYRAKAAGRNQVMAMPADNGAAVDAEPAKDSGATKAGAPADAPPLAKAAA